jgi:hypothetical protein
MSNDGKSVGVFQGPADVDGHPIGVLPVEPAGAPDMLEVVGFSAKPGENVLLCV